MAFAQLTYRESLRESKRACVRSAPSSTTWDAPRWRAPHWPTPTVARLADLCRFRPGLDSHRAALVRPRSDRRRRSKSVRAGLDHHRPVPFAVPVGNVPTGKAAVKMHTLLDLRGNIPTFIRITDGKTHDVNILDEIDPEPGAFYVMDRPTSISNASSCSPSARRSSSFVPRSSCSSGATRIPSTNPRGMRSDQTVILTAIESAKAYPTRCGESATSTPRRTSG